MVVPSPASQVGYGGFGNATTETLHPDSQHFSVGRKAAMHPLVSLIQTYVCSER